MSDEKKMIIYQVLPRLFGNNNNHCVYNGDITVNGCGKMADFTAKTLEEIKKLNNFKIGINGVITFKNSRLSEIIRQTDIRKIVLETDAPYLAPVPYRGKRNEPAYIWKTAEKVAQTYGLTLEETVETTRINALKLFKIENKPIS